MTLTTINDLERVSSRYVIVDGLQIHYHALDGQGDKVTVFLHGGGPGCTGWSDFHEVAIELAATGPRLLVDLPQYGRSDKPAIAGPVLTFHAGILRRLLEVLGIGRARFVCQSLGGCVALRMAIDHPTLVTRLVLTASQPVLSGLRQPSRLVGGLGARIRSDYYGGEGPSLAKMRDLLARYEWFDGSRVPETTVKRRYESSVAADGQHIVRDQARRGQPEDLASDLHRNTVNTLLVWGQHDCFSGPDAALFMANRFRRGRVYVLPESAHHPQEEHPALYSRLAHEFLEH